MTKTKLKNIIFYLILALPLIIYILSIIMPFISLTSDNINADLFENYYADKLDFYGNFVQFITELDVNTWYRSLINAVLSPTTLLSMFNQNNVFSLVLIMPLWAFWCYLFKLITNCLCAIPKILNNIISKIGGGKNDN